MLKILAHRTGGGSVLILGLSDANVAMLKEGRALHIDGESCALPGMHFLIIGADHPQTAKPSRTVYDFGIGLSDQVLDGMDAEDKHVALNTGELTIVVYRGRTEQSMLAEVREKAGKLIGAETKVTFEGFTPTQRLDMAGSTGN